MHITPHPGYAPPLPSQPDVLPYVAPFPGQPVWPELPPWAQPVYTPTRPGSPAIWC